MLASSDDAEIITKYCGMADVINNVRFGSITSLPVQAKIDLCLLCSVSDHFGRGVDWSLSAITGLYATQRARPCACDVIVMEAGRQTAI